MSVEYFEGFKWAVPTAFRAALDDFGFKRGDTLYDTRSAYEMGWADALKVMDRSIRVRYPDQPSAASADGASQMEAKWSSEIRLDLFGKNQRLEQQMESTQGRLYTALWHGDVSVLSLDADEPPLPRRASDVLRLLDSVSERATTETNGGAVFVMPLDRANLRSLEKHDEVMAKLESHLEGDARYLSAEEAGIPNPDLIAPTVVVALFPTSELTADATEELVKTVLYSGGESTADKFRVSAHGAIF